MSAVLHALAAALAHFVWQGALIAGLLAILLRGLREASPRARYAIACSALLAMALAPLLTFATIARQDLAQASLTMAVAHTQTSRAATPRDYVALLLPLAWAVGVVLMGARLAGGALQLRRLRARSVDAETAIQSLAHTLAEKLGVTRMVRVAFSFDVDVPMVLGLLRPLILLPASMGCGLPSSMIEAVLAHELAHVRRHDFLVNAAQSAIETLLFYHPCVFWVSRRIREERELACDDAAVALLGDSLGYARALVSLESQRQPTPALVVAATGGSLMSRIERLLTSSRRADSSRLWPTLLACAALLACGAIPLVACGVSHEESTATTASADTSWLPASVSRWAPQFAVAGRRHGVAPELLAIVTLLESRGNPEAKSPIGAVGLMQVMPATAAKIAAARNLPAVQETGLGDPELNIDFGAFYLSEQLKTFATPGDEARSIELAAAAYNAGPDSVRAYVAEGKPLSEETTRYKNRVVALWREHHAATAR